MSEEKKEDNLANAIHEVDKYVRLNDRDHALDAIEHLRTFVAKQSGTITKAPEVQTTTEIALKSIAESLEFIAQTKAGPSTRKKN